MAWCEDDPPIDLSRWGDVKTPPATNEAFVRRERLREQTALEYKEHRRMCEGQKYCHPGEVILLPIDGELLQHICVFDSERYRWCYILHNI